MKYTPYSHSKISTYQQCPRKFDYLYVQKLPVINEPRDFFDRGKFIHMLFEYDGDLSKIKKTTEFQEIKKHNFFTKEQYKEFILEYQTFKKQNSWLFNLKDIINELPIALNKNLERCEYKSPETIHRGYIDSVKLDIETNTLYCIDYKTGKKPDKISFQQLLFYSIALFSEMPYDEIKLVFAYTGINHTETRTVKREFLDRYKKAFFKIVEPIENDKEFKPNPSGLCQFCGFEEICNPDFTSNIV